MKQTLLFSSYRGRNRGSERQNSLLKVTQLVRGRDRIWNSLTNLNGLTTYCTTHLPGFWGWSGPVLNVLKLEMVKAGPDAPACSISKLTSFQFRSTFSVYHLLSNIRKLLWALSSSSTICHRLPHVRYCFAYINLLILLVTHSEYCPTL